jgi:hypothetical protein
MRDLDALLNSLVKIDRNSLVTILSSEAEVVQRLLPLLSGPSDAAPSSVPLASIAFCDSSSTAMPDGHIFREVPKPTQ